MGYDRSPCPVEGSQDAGLLQARRPLPAEVPFWKEKDSVLTLGSIYVSDIALVVCLQEGRTADTSAELSPAVSGNLKETIGRLMRMVIGYAEQVGLFVPAYCMVCGPEDSHIVREMSKAAADQDWHRGDFAIETARGKSPHARGEEGIADLILDVPYKAFMARLEPIGRETLLRRIDEEIGARVLSDKRIELLTVIKAVIRDDRDPKSEVLQWVEDRIKDVAAQQEESD